MKLSDGTTNINTDSSKANNWKVKSHGHQDNFFWKYLKKMLTNFRVELRVTFSKDHMAGLVLPSPGQIEIPKRERGGSKYSPINVSRHTLHSVGTQTSIEYTKMTKHLKIVNQQTSIELGYRKSQNIWSFIGYKSQRTFEFEHCSSDTLRFATAKQTKTLKMFTFDCAVCA